MIALALILAIGPFGEMPKMPSGTEKKMLEERAAATHSTKPSSQESPDVMLIHPSARAADWVAAFQYLSTHATEKSVVFKLTNGSLIHNVIDVAALPGGTLMTFTLNTMTGLQYKVVKIEDVDDIVQN